MTDNHKIFCEKKKFGDIEGFSISETYCGSMPPRDQMHTPEREELMIEKRIRMRNLLLEMDTPAEPIKQANRLTRWIKEKLAWKGKS
jgi:hypothetical protein